MMKYYVTFKTYGGPSAVNRTMVPPTVHRIASRHLTRDAAERELRRNFAAGILEIESEHRPRIGAQVWA